MAHSPISEDVQADFGEMRKPRSTVFIDIVAHRIIAPSGAVSCYNGAWIWSLPWPDALQ